jgi:ABC-type Mn2+/Zn2+ transport system permease subunit
VTLTIVLGIRIAGSVLVTALLVLPGATALMLSQNLRTVFVTAIITAAFAAAGGVGVHQRWHFVPAGPAMVLVLFAEFIGCYGGKHLAALRPVLTATEAPDVHPGL